MLPQPDEPNDTTPGISPPEAASQPETGSRRSFLWRLLGTLLSLGLLVYLIAAQGWQEFAQAFSRLPLGTFLLALGLMLLSRLAVSLRWFVLLRSAQVKLSFWQCLRLVFMGLFASNFLPSTVGGDLVRMAGAVSQRVDPGVGAASLVLDRLIGMAGMSSFAPVGLAILIRAGGIPSDALMPAWALSGLSRLPGFDWLARRLKRFFRSAASSAGYWFHHPSSLLLALFFTYGHMVFTFLVISVLLDGMHEPLSFWWIGGLWSLSYFISLAPFAINGLGLQELSISLLYSRFGGVSTEVGLALAVFMRMIPMLASLPGVLFLPDILRPLAERGKRARPPEAS